MCIRVCVRVCMSEQDGGVWVRAQLRDLHGAADHVGQQQAPDGDQEHK